MTNSNALAPERETEGAVFRYFVTTVHRN